MYSYSVIPGVTARINAAYGQGVGPIFLDDVRCTGLEYRLIECSNRGIEVENCNHNEDAGVRCVAGEYEESIQSCALVLMHYMQQVALLEKSAL